MHALHIGSCSTLLRPFCEAPTISSEGRFFCCRSFCLVDCPSDLTVDFFFLSRGRSNGNRQHQLQLFHPIIRDAIDVTKSHTPSYSLYHTTAITWLAPISSQPSQDHGLNSSYFCCNYLSDDSQSFAIHFQGLSLLLVASLISI